jgi:hypothetical protein
MSMREAPSAPSRCIMHRLRLRRCVGATLLSDCIPRACCWLTLTNDPPGAVQEFDRTKLLSVFDAIRDSVKLT